MLRCKSPEMVEKEIWMHLLAYNLIRGMMARAAESHGEQPRHLSFKGTLQTMTAFQDMLRQVTAVRRAYLLEEMLRAIASHRVVYGPAGEVKQRIDGIVRWQRRSRSHPESGCTLNRLPRNPQYFSVNSWMIVNMSYGRYLRSKTVVDFGSCEVFSMVFV